MVKTSYFYFFFLTLLALSNLVHCYKPKSLKPIGHYFKQNLEKFTTNNPEFNSSSSSKFVSQRTSPVHFGTQNSLKESDKIEKLPGEPEGVDFNQYSGYVTVDSSAGRALFYYFVESPSDSASKPLVLWLNGGPGCSSLGGGAFGELGPFRVNKDGTLQRNQFSWISEANIIFLESPAGVGFSYTNTSSDFNFSGDRTTARDSYTFLVNWLERFPEYKANDFYLIGESYAGHYVPQLAQLILQHNNNSNKTISTINLKGIAIGNAYVDFEANMKGTTEYYWSHALISEELYNKIISTCNFSSPSSVSKKCNAYLDQIDEETGNIFIYNVYAPLCNNGSPSSTSISDVDPCLPNYIQSYFNIPEVQKAMHANVTNLPYPWESCNNTLNLNWKDRPLSVLPLLHQLMKSELRIWLYSGDMDVVVPVTDTRYAIKKLNLSVKTSWYPWYLQGEVGGYVEEYENLTLVTIRGAGHFVPTYQPNRALAFFSHFLSGKPPHKV
ncbi:putative serine carboxypeptidase-like 23 [Solanum tuberosum]|uniref:putative serine carboxypeptidase-like 23 n=1 Tax=Solanum tuberosum TaxID=4113 RepID=UPI0003D251E7|nr:PREDICTED: putative serine carboxypeptidase-like 23 [Solanum tuberosum]